MTQTPRTDALELENIGLAWGDAQDAVLGLARELERELEQERQDRKQADLDTIRALGERNDARAEIDQIKAILADPVAVHINMLRGTIAWSPANLRHLIGDTGDARAIIDATLKALPVGYIPAHTSESLPGRVADLVSELAVWMHEAKACEP